MTWAQRRTYAREIVKVLEYRVPDYVCSTADWDYLAKLMDREIPLAVVLLGMHQSNGTPRRVTLRYFKPAIEERIRSWERALA